MMCPGIAVQKIMFPCNVDLLDEDHVIYSVNVHKKCYLCGGMTDGPMKAGRETNKTI